MKKTKFYEHYLFYIGLFFLYQLLGLAFKFKTTEEFKIGATICIVLALGYLVLFKLFKINKTGPIPWYASPITWGIITVIAAAIFIGKV